MPLLFKSLSVDLFVSGCWKSAIWFSSSSVHDAIYQYIHHPVMFLVVSAYGMTLNHPSFQFSKSHWRKSFLCDYTENSIGLCKIVYLGSSHSHPFCLGYLMPPPFPRSTWKTKYTFSCFYIVQNFWYIFNVSWIWIMGEKNKVFFKENCFHLPTTTYMPLSF